MQLDTPFTLVLPNGKPQPQPQTTEVVVESVINDIVRKRVYARLKNYAVSLLLWDKDKYDLPEAQWTDASAQARAEQLAPNTAALKALLPLSLKKLNP